MQRVNLACAWYLLRMALVIARYHEITLKRGNRARFVAQLIANIRRATSDFPLGKIADRHGRVVLELDADSAWPALRERLRRVFGIANFSLARSVPWPPIEDGRPADLAPLAHAIVEEIRPRHFDSFRVLTRRADKRFPLPSPAVNAVVGAVIKEATERRVDLDHADLTVTIEILRGEMLYSVEKVPGAGGLPVGVSGHVVALLSGGIDSPVAAARMMRRGCRVTFVHFHSAPYLDRSSQEKAREIVRRLVAYHGDARLVLVPFGEVQREIVTGVPPPPRVILYRRMMVRIASEIARRIGGEALVTGDSLGQVASQTLPNLAVVEQAASLPVYRPLIGMDKLEVSSEAQRLGTFEVSIEPGEDCCSLFVPRHPTTRAHPEAIAAVESALDVPRLVGMAIDGAVVERYRYPVADREPAAEPLRAARERL
ncbi:MAG TPA: tRNA uracil 4-sulfurtransferase ThiI [Candidatus Binatia bacterium]|nr:tRNA uracil 4-sulfurtransferase ThiI [Candidatus Binatia bacterium]